MTHGDAFFDFYQLTSLVTHHAAGRADDRVVMTFFSRALPKSPHTGETARGYLLWVGLSHGLDHLQRARISGEAVETIASHAVLGPALRRHPELMRRLADWRFSGTIHAPPEGTPIACGPAVRSDGSPLEIEGVRPAAYVPYLVVETDLLSAKLIETPLLSYINHMSMVASKAAHVVEAAKGKPVIEFGARRTHPHAAVDASLAAYIAGCSATSNVEAHLRHGVPITGTMDHFAVQSWEQPGVPVHETETAFFRAFHEMYPGHDALLVDTYDTFGEQTGIAAAVAATGTGPHSIRIDSNVSAETVRRARQRLDALGARDTRVVVSGGVDEAMMASLGDAPVDGFGVGENLVVSSDAPVGVGAVAKLSMIRGVPTTKLSRGSGKAHLPGVVQAWRQPGGAVVVGLRGEDGVPGEPLLREVWNADSGRLPSPPWTAVRATAKAGIAALSPENKVKERRPVPVTDRLAALFEATVRRGPA